MPSKKVAWDTSCLVAALLIDHQHHQLTVREFSRQQDAQNVVSVHSLLECFSVITRFPPPLRVTTRTAVRLLRTNLEDHLKVADVTPADAWAAIEEVRLSGGSGGSVYDAAIAQSVARAGASVLFTWNVKDFLRVAPPGLQVRAPLD